MKFSLRSIPAFALLALAVVAGCTSNASSESETPSTEDDIHASCTNPRRYIVVGSNDCTTNIPANRGTWVSSPVFADAPAGTSCYFTWSGAKSARIDYDAFWKALRFPMIATESCGAKTDDATLVDISESDFDSRHGAGHGIGAIGCDVCGMEHDGKIWVVLPPERVLFHELQVKLSNGASRSFRIDRVGTARQLSFTLPPPPAGASYVSGRIQVQ